MEFKQIQELIKQINKSGISELSIQDGEFQITIKQESVHHFMDAPQMQMPMMMPMQMSQSVPTPAIAGATSAAVESAPAATSAATGIPIKSPMIGTFYRSAGPDKPIFVNIGDEVKVGQVICIIEAMKLFNEIESEVSGRIIKVLADDASPVEYDQPLFLVEPI
ncbi:MAG: acetyl-CoA carboxylase biotin carboxyl carrier protein [Chitinophagaceae bacterium]